MEHGLRRIFTDEGMLISSRMQKVLACNGVALSVIEIQEIANARAPVSYTHLDVYKRQLLNLTVEVTPEEVVYHGVCPEHGAFVRSEPRADLSELGVKVSSTVGIRGQQASVA